MVHSNPSPYSRPEEDPVLLLQSTLKAVEVMLRRSAGQAMRRSWIAVPYGEEEITRLEEEVIPVLRSYLERVEEIDRQRAVIDDQFEMLGATIEDLKLSNRRLKQLAEDLRTLSASPDFATMKASLGLALEHMQTPDAGKRAEHALLYARVPDTGRFVRIGRPSPLALGVDADGEQWPEEVGAKWLSDRAGPGLVGYADREGQVSMWMVRGRTDRPPRAGALSPGDDPGDGRHGMDAIAHAAAITLDNIRLVERAREEERQRAQIATARIEAELTHLKSQMNPHFLFNALNSVAHLVEVNPNEAVAALARLAKLYRRIMKVSEGVTVTLREELEVVRLYLEIEQMRFTDRLSFAIHCEVDDAAVQVPGLMIQTLVDNAIKHGIARRASGGAIQVTARHGGESGQDVVIEVTDDSGTAGRIAEPPTAGRSDRRYSSEAGGTGLDNVRRRIGLLFGSRAKLTLLVAENGPTVARVVIPGRRLP